MFDVNQLTRITDRNFHARMPNNDCTHSERGTYHQEDESGALGQSGRQDVDPFYGEPPSMRKFWRVPLARHGASTTKLSPRPLTRAHQSSYRSRAMDLNPLKHPLRSSIIVPRFRYATVARFGPVLPVVLKSLSLQSMIPFGGVATITVFVPAKQPASSR